MMLWRWIVRQWDKLTPRSPGLLKRGQWRVIYDRDPDWPEDLNNVSAAMTYDAAKEYAAVFGGQVIHIRYRERCEG